MNAPASPRYTLLCPGPVNVAQRVAEAYSQIALSHREEAFAELLGEVQRDLLAIAGVDMKSHSALVITGSGTAANEAVLASAVPPGATVIVLANGEFGERLAGISAVYNDTRLVRSGWGEELNLGLLATLLTDMPQALVAMVHHETSTGLLNPINEVGRLCRDAGVPLLVDAVSSFAADKVDLRDSGITFLTTSSGKALACYPGLSFVLGGNQDFARLAAYPVKNHYLNLARYYQVLQEEGQTPNTPAVSLVASLHTALREIHTEGLERRYRRLFELAAHMRRQLSVRGLYTPPAKPQSVVLTNARLPEKRSFAEIERGLKAREFVVYDAKGPLKGHFFQVSTIGDITAPDIDRFFTAFDAL